MKEEENVEGRKSKLEMVTQYLGKVCMHATTSFIYPLGEILQPHAQHSACVALIFIYYPPVVQTERQ